MMTKLMNSVVAFLRDEEGLTTVEYAIGGSLVALAVVLAFENLGIAVGGAVDDMTNVIENGSGATN